MEKLNKALKLIKEEGLSGLLVTKEANVKYLSNYKDEAACLLLTNKGNYFITDGRFIELAEKQAKGLDFNFINWQKESNSMIQALADLFAKLDLDKLGFEKYWTSYADFQAMETSFKGSSVKLVGKEGIVEELRYVKTPEEIEKIRKASEITDHAFEEILKYIEIGMTENQVAAKLEYIVKMAGADGMGFDTILISGSKTSLPHGKPTNKLIEAGDFVTMDFGAMVDGYTSDMTRTIVMGQASQEQMEVYRLVKEAQQKGMESIKPLVTSDLPDQAVREVLKDRIQYYYPGT